METPFDPMLLAIPGFFLLIVLEVMVMKFRKEDWYDLEDSITNLNIGIGNQVFGLLSKGLIIGGLIGLYHEYALFQIPVNVFSIFTSLLLFDFLFYWSHRWSHEMNFFWAAHVVHHQSEEYNLTVALRQSWFHNLIMFFMFIPLPLLGVPPEILLPVALFHTLYQFWIHTKAIDKLPRPIEWIMNTPSHHRVHHAIDPQYIDKNHAGVFIIWDRLFGTFCEEVEQPTYGVTTTFKSLNPVWSNFQHYASMIQDAKQMSNWKDRFRSIFAPPGWLPEELGGYRSPQAVDKASYKKWRINATWTNRSYALWQFVLIMIGLVGYMSHYEELTPIFKATFALLLILSLALCGGILENRSWVVPLEYIRLLALVIGLNTCYYLWYKDWFVWMLLGSTVGFALSNIWFTLVWRYNEKGHPGKVAF